MIYDYHRNTCSLTFILPDIELSIEENHISLCTAMFQSVLTPYLYEDDDLAVEYGFTENLVLQTLDSVPGLRTLRLITHESRVVERTLLHLTHVEVFSYQYNCTDELIEQLGLHCHNLKEIYVSGFRKVTNASVPHLLRLRKVEILEVTHTDIDDEHYWLLLSELPIKNIRFSPPHENILGHVADGKLHKISRRGRQLWDVVYIYIYIYINHLLL
jgi:hypothetical protein